MKNENEVIVSSSGEAGGKVKLFLSSPLLFRSG